MALAEHISGSVEGFVCLMNEKASEYEMENTKFVNCTGLPDQDQYSCAEDVGKMFMKLIEKPEFFEYSGIWMFDFVHPGGRVTSLSNTNKLVRFYQGCDGGKPDILRKPVRVLPLLLKEAIRDLLRLL